MWTHEPNRSGTQAIARAATLLRALARHGRDGARLVDLCRSTGLSRPTIHRILQGLIEEQLAAQDQISRRYRLGALVFELGLAGHHTAQVIETFRPILRRLAEGSEDTLYLVRRSGGDAVCLDRIEGSFPIRVLTLEIGGRRPLGMGPASLALLASLDDGEVGQILQRNARDVAGYDPAETRAAVTRTRTAGYALTRGAITPGVDGLGMAVPNPAGLPWLAISIASISSRLQEDRVPGLLRLIRAELDRLPETARSL